MVSVTRPPKSGYASDRECREARDLAVLVRRCAGARRRVRLDSPPAILREVPMRRLGLAVVLTIGLFEIIQ